MAQSSFNEFCKDKEIFAKFALAQNKIKHAALDCLSPKVTPNWIKLVRVWKRFVRSGALCTAMYMQDDLCD